MILLVTGWRDHPDEHAVYDVLDEFLGDLPLSDRLLVIHGACPTGADDYAHNWATFRRIPVRAFPASDYGRWPWAGPRRNKVMVKWLVENRDSGKRVLAFPQPDWETARVCGTRGCIREAEKAGLVPDIHVARAVIA